MGAIETDTTDPDMDIESVSDDEAVGKVTVSDEEVVDIDEDNRNEVMEALKEMELRRRLTVGESVLKWLLQLRPLKLTLILKELLRCGIDFVSEAEGNAVA